MAAFLLVFPLVAVLSVPVLTWLMLRTASREAAARGRDLVADGRGLFRLLTVAVLICLLFLVVRVAAPRDVVPANVLALLVALGGFHGLWWSMGMRLVRAQNAALQAVRVQEPTQTLRTASLDARRARDYLHPSLLSLPAIIGIAGCVVISWRAVTAPVSPTGIAIAGVFTLCALGELILYRWWLHAEVQAPPQLAGGDPEWLRREWESLRRFRVRAVFTFHCALPALFLIFAALSLETSRGAIGGAAMGIAGGIAGTVVGLAGGIFGVYADLRRRRIEVRRAIR
ncbi:MAG: hypothetical protein MUE60_06715 [Candidatus Eisenbacteria bacterium]|nr:hypothetical protein [Candidatus Eisenbacteria bacterium]